MLRRIGTAVVETLYPRRCVACGRFGEFICAVCRAGMVPATGAGRCPNCRAAWDGELNCPACAHWGMTLDLGAAAFEMSVAARRAVHALKYGRVRALGPALAAAIAPVIDRASFDVAYPIPLHRARVRERGFNQAEVLLDALGWPRGPGRLERSRKTRSQVGLAIHERRANVAGAFRYEGPELDGLRIVLVDDVVTTGATALECARVLKGFGAVSVVVVSFARANAREGAVPLD